MPVTIAELEEDLSEAEKEFIKAPFIENDNYLHDENEAMDRMKFFLESHKEELDEMLRKV